MNALSRGRIHSRVGFAFAGWCAAGVVGVGLLAQAARSVEPPKAAGPVDVRIHNPGPEFRLVGRLGMPMGESAKVRGLIVEGPFKGYEGGLNVVVQRLNGVATQEIVTLRVRPYFGDWGGNLEGDRKMPTPEVGKTFELDVYETGGYVGIPSDAYARGGIGIQTTGHYFSSTLAVFGGAQAEEVLFSPSDYVNRQALVEGTARNEGGRAWIVGPGEKWRVEVSGGVWTAEEGKLVGAYGVVRAGKAGQFTLEAAERRGMVTLGDLVGGEVAIRGEALSYNVDRVLEYRGQPILLHLGKTKHGRQWPHAEPVLVKGKLEKLATPRKDDRGNTFEYRLTVASWEAATPLLMPEVNFVSGK